VVFKFKVTKKYVHYSSFQFRCCISCLRILSQSNCCNENGRL